ncbi:ubiquitin carboxyl-terminal hydrolase MIY1 [Trichomonascus vanleenenianus]|uniref:MINDY family deubiquitinase n=1 Tax=Trichomonascus vanleenenianus TaxID=2268995 RepID=UPI003EC9BFB5
MSSQVEVFETKRIVVQRDGEDVEATILLQNENGPCPLVALVNTLVLSEHTSKKANGNSSALSLASFTYGKPKISVNEILDLLGELLLAKVSEQGAQAPQDTSDGASVQSGMVDGEDHSQATDAVLKLLPKLATGMNINVRFNGTFDNTPEMALFRLYDVDIVHGWTFDPDDPEYTTISTVESYDDAQALLLKASEDSEIDAETRAQAEAIRHFFAHNPTQLTTYGLREVRDLLTPDIPAVLFRNDHFATIVKHGGTLYTLVADQGFKDQKSIVWQSLIDALGGNDYFYTGSFVPHAIDDTQHRGDEHTDVTEDFLIAQQMQLQADEELAQELAQEGAGQQRRDQRQRQRRQRQSQKLSGQETQKKKKDKGCVVM